VKLHDSPEPDPLWQGLDIIKHAVADSFDSTEAPEIRTASWEVAR